MAGKVKDKLDNLDVALFDKKEIKKVLKNVSTESNDYFQDYQDGKIKCFSCNKVIGPKSKENKILGAILFNKDEIRFSCQDIECYDQSLE